MTNELSPPKLNWPRWQWRENLWLSLIPFVLGFLVFFIPELNEKSYRVLRLLIGLPLLFSPLLIPAIVWTVKAIRVSYLRNQSYPYVHKTLLWLNNELIDSKKEIYNLVRTEIGPRSFEITRAGLVQGNLTIAVKKRRTPKLIAGDALLVVHKSDGQAMGQFEVIEERKDDYLATGVKSVDLVWLGHIKENGETALLPNMVAIHNPRREE